jgi:hypothetical protein
VRPQSDLALAVGLHRSHALHQLAKVTLRHGSSSVISAAGPTLPAQGRVFRKPRRGAPELTAPPHETTVVVEVVSTLSSFQVP